MRYDMRRKFLRKKGRSGAGDRAANNGAGECVTGQFDSEESTAVRFDAAAAIFKALSPLAVLL